MHPSPVQISILILDESTMLTVASVIDPMRAANRLSGHKLFDWKLYSATGNDICLTGGVTMAADGVFDDNCHGDVLLLIASFNQRQNASSSTIQTLRRIASGYDLIGGVEAGTWLLARAGLVSAHSVTTHWEDFENLAGRYPALNVRSDRIVIDGKYWTCGGANPALDMMLELITHYYSKTTALQIASVFIYDQSHTATDPQPYHSLGLIEQREPRVAEAVRLMENTIEEPISIVDIAGRLQITVRTLENLFKRYLDKSPSAYYLHLRLTTAHKMVVDSDISLQHISVITGFSSQSSFNRAFKHGYGVSPGKLRC